MTEIFFGTEDEDDARFVQLEDCGHVFEVTGLDQWMDMAADRRAAVDIQMKQCPRCKTTIRRNLRYGNIINALLSDIERVKGRILGDTARNSTRQKDLLRRLVELELTEEQRRYFEDRLGIVGLAQEEVTCLENVVNCLKNIVEWRKKVDDAIGVAGGEIEVRAKLNKLRAEVEPLMSWCLRQRVLFCDQELREARLEITRFHLRLMFVQLEEKLKKSENPRMTDAVRRRFQRSLQHLESGQPLTDATDAEARRAAEELRPLLGGLGISEAERVEIVNAMGMSTGHWFKCPNGHIYAIGDCGGAMQRSTCPECRAEIGGANHALTAGNQLAGEMDGATAPAFNPNLLMNEEQLRAFMFH